MRKKILATVMAGAMILSGCGGAGSNGGGDKIKVGGLAPLTGKVAIYGVSASNGTKLAFEEINANGGILGKQVEFILEDEKGEVVDAKNAYGKLVSEGIDALIGDITSGPTYAVAEDAEADGIPMITPTGTQFNITEGRTNIFRVCYTDPYQGEVLAKYMKNNLKKTKVAVMKNTSSDYSNGVAQKFEEEAKALGLDVVVTVSYGDEDKDFKAQLAQINEKKPELILIPDYYEKIALIAPQAREAGVEAKFIGPDGWDGILQQFGGDEASLKTVEGAVFANHYSQADKAEKVQNFVKAYKDKYNEDPTAFSALGYDAAYLLKEAMEKAGTTDKAKVVEALKGIDFDGVTGRLKFDDNNNPIKDITIIKIENGDYIFDSVVNND
ncbi:MAG: ABC transporter substrate-binding protein [Eubacteriales bacterium]|nr:ABC transporter substrate-binding protein [Eubacteriales bacterium]